MRPVPVRPAAFRSGVLCRGAVGERMKRDETKGTTGMAGRPKRGVPEGLWQLCPGCQSMIYRKEAEKRLSTCPECEFHWYVPARQRIEQVPI